MKKIIFILLIAFSVVVNEQTQQADELVRIHSVTTVEMNAIVNSVDGSSVFNINNKCMYPFDGSAWKKRLQSKDIMKYNNMR